ncbi:MAG: cobalt ECF transporter T component CbiQ, partial [Thermodesulfobacteriota bacterium]
LTQIFFYGTTPAMELNLFGFHLTGYKEGLLRGFLIMAKVIGSVSWIIFLSMTTPVNKILNAAQWFKVPHICVEIFMLTFRYVFVLLEDAMIVRDAQRVRSGYSSFARSLQSIGQLAGTVVIRSYDQSIAIYEAMLLRGYNGRMMNFTYKDRLSIKDGIASILFIFVIVLFFTLNKAL